MSVPPCHPSLRKTVRERHFSGITKFAYTIVQCKRYDILVGDVTRSGYLPLIRRLEFDYTLIFFVRGKFIAVSGADKILHKAIIYPFDWPREGKFPTAGHRRVSVLRHRDSFIDLVLHGKWISAGRPCLTSLHCVSRRFPTNISRLARQRSIHYRFVVPHFEIVM